MFWVTLKQFRLLQGNCKKQVFGFPYLLILKKIKFRRLKMWVRQLWNCIQAAMRIYQTQNKRS